MHIVNPEETIVKLREAIEKDEQTIKAHEEHIKYLRSLQEREKEIVEGISNLQSDLKKIQEDIVSALDVDFDYSDEMTLTAAKELLANLEGKKNGESK